MFLEQLTLLKKSEEEINEFLKLSYKIMSFAKERKDEVFFTQVCNDINQMVELKHKFVVARKRIETSKVGSSQVN